MLGKLIKNDLKSAWRSVVYIYFALFIAVGAMGISLVTDFMMGRALSSIVMVSISILAVIVTIFVVFLDYKKTMFGDRGYLTNTLPVTSHSLMLSKTLTSMIWIGISYVVVAAVIAFLYLYNTESNEAVELSMILEMLPELGIIKSVEVAKIVLVGVAVKGIFFIAVFVTIAFFALTLSNIRPFQKLGMMGTIIFFFTIYALMAFLGGKLADLLNLNILIAADTSLSFTTNQTLIDEVASLGGHYISLTQTLFQIILSIAMFIINGELVERKVNIK